MKIIFNSKEIELQNLEGGQYIEINNGVIDEKSVFVNLETYVADNPTQTIIANSSWFNEVTSLTSGQTFMIYDGKTATWNSTIATNDFKTKSFVTLVQDLPSAITFYTTTLNGKDLYTVAYGGDIYSLEGDTGYDVSNTSITIDESYLSTDSSTNPVALFVKTIEESTELAQQLLSEINAKGAEIDSLNEQLSEASSEMDDQLSELSEAIQEGLNGVYPIGTNTPDYINISTSNETTYVDLDPDIIEKIDDNPILSVTGTNTGTYYQITATHQDGTVDNIINIPVITVTEVS